MQNAERRRGNERQKATARGGQEHGRARPAVPHNRAAGGHGAVGNAAACFRTRLTEHAVKGAHRGFF